MEFICKREKLLMPPFSNITRIQMYSTSLQQHMPSQDILDIWKRTEIGIPVASSTDGSCLFSSASLALRGDNSLSTELRVRCCVALVSNRDNYMSLENVDDIELNSPPYTEAWQKCASKAGYSSQWTLYALSEVIDRPINVYYPPVNTKRDPAYSAFNTEIIPSTSALGKPPISILWTRCLGLHNYRNIWAPDHFVPLLPLPTTNPIPFKTLECPSLSPEEDSKLFRQYSKRTPSIPPQTIGWPSLSPQGDSEHSQKDTTRTSLQSIGWPSLSLSPSEIPSGENLPYTSKMVIDFEPTIHSSPKNPF